MTTGDLEDGNFFYFHYYFYDVFKNFEVKSVGTILNETYSSIWTKCDRDNFPKLLTITLKNVKIINLDAKKQLSKAELCKAGID